MLSKLTAFNRSRLFWLALFVFGLALELAALFYQYVLDYAPCVLCVHIRAWIALLMVAALLGLMLRSTRFGLIMANLLSLGAALAMAERSYRTLGTERGFIQGSCSMNPGFPNWLALDQWLPSVFQPLEACGYTPWVIPQWLTMAEALIVMSVGLVLVLLLLLISSLFKAANPQTTY